MHVIFRESHGLEESETPTDLGQSPADLVVLSFSDSDLGAFAEAWHRAAGGLPELLQPGAPIGEHSGVHLKPLGEHLCDLEANVCEPIELLGNGEDCEAELRLSITHVESVRDHQLPIQDSPRSPWDP